MHYDFFITFLFLLAFSGILINGWHVATRGWETKLPDGTIRKDGRLLKGWYFFWNKKKPYDKYILFNTDYTVNFMRNAVGEKGYFPTTASNGKYVTKSEQLVLNKNRLEKEYNVTIDIHEGTNEKDWHFSIHKTEPDYVYPEWVRDMLVECIYCFASLYGSIIFWMIHLLAIGSDFYVYMYGWANNKFLAIVLTWIAFVISLSYVNGYFFKKINK